MTTSKSNAKPTTSATKPLEGVENPWGEPVEQLTGADLLDKMELEGRRFLMTGIKNTVNPAGVLFAWIEGKFQNGETFMFNDSGKGIRAQIDAYLESKGKAGTLDEWIDCHIDVPKGLRISHFDAVDERGRPVKARTAYLTTGGGRS